MVCTVLAIIIIIFFLQRSERWEVFISVLGSVARALAWIYYYCLEAGRRPFGRRKVASAGISRDLTRVLPDGQVWKGPPYRLSSYGKASMGKEVLVEWRRIACIVGQIAAVCWEASLKLEEFWMMIYLSIYLSISPRVHFSYRSGRKSIKKGV